MKTKDQKIAVAVRLRPTNEREAGQRKTWSTDGERQVTGRKKSWTFDRVFSEGSTNEEIYDNFARPIVEDAMRGFHGAIIAYGQTSTGKTFTVQGTPSSPGLIPLAIEDCFDQIEANSESEYVLRVSYLEVYNETLRDLLSDGTPRLVEDPKGGTKIAGCLEENVASIADVFDAVVRGEAKRQVGETDANARSSRSHAVLRLTIESRFLDPSSNTPASSSSSSSTLSSSTNYDDKAIWVATLSFCDLAGSERCHPGSSSSGTVVPATKAAAYSRQQVQRQKEGAFINKSLHALAHVVAKLSSQDERDRAHVPYRDSKLTRLLRPALGGNARVGIVCTCSPCDVDETANTLQFATRAKKVTQVATRNSVVDTESQLAAYKQQVQDLKQRLAELEVQRPPPVAPSSPVAQQPEKMMPDEERDALASAVDHLERLILRSGNIVPDKLDDGPVPSHQPAHLEPRFFATNARRRKSRTRSMTLPPRALVPPMSPTVSRPKDDSLPRPSIDDGGGGSGSPTTLARSAPLGALERVNEDDDGATAAAPARDDGDPKNPEQLTPQLVRIKEVLQRVLIRGDSSVDDTNLRSLLKKSQDDTAFVLEQLDKAEGTPPLLLFSRRFSFPRSRESPPQGPRRPPDNYRSIPRGRDPSTQGSRVR